MNLKTARILANYLISFRKVDHVIIKNGNKFFVEMAKNFKGNPYETIEYKKYMEDNKEETKAKKESKKIQGIHDLSGASDKEIL